MCFNKVEGPKTLRRHTLVKTSITQITGDFIKKIRIETKSNKKERKQIHSLIFSSFFHDLNATMLLHSRTKEQMSAAA